MTDVDLIKQVTEDLSRNDEAGDVLAAHFDPNFTFWSNGTTGTLADFTERLKQYAGTFQSIEIQNWDVLVPTDIGVLVSYIFDTKTHEGVEARMAVMAVWGVTDGKITSLREVLAGI